MPIVQWASLSSFKKTERVCASPSKSRRCLKFLIIKSAVIANFLNMTIGYYFILFGDISLGTEPEVPGTGERSEAAWPGGGNSGRSKK